LEKDIDIKYEAICEKKIYECERDQRYRNQKLKKVERKTYAERDRIEKWDIETLICSLLISPLFVTVLADLFVTIIFKDRLTTAYISFGTQCD
jgi:hypothetical protein